MLHNGQATKLAIRPPCDLHSHDETAPPAIVDGATTCGPWANMCETHYARIGRGLGLGVGQALLCDDDLDFTIKRRFHLV